MKFSKLAEYFERIEQTSSRVEITKLLAELFHELTPAELEKAVYLLQGRVVPLYESKEFGMAEKMIIRAVVSALQLDQTDFVKEYKKIGDMGTSVEHYKKMFHSLEEEDLSVRQVYDELYTIVEAGGSGSQEIKIQILSHLVRRLDARSCRYVVRIPQGVMRLGFSDMTILDALSWMQTGDKSLRPPIEKAYHVRPDLGSLGRILKEKGVEGIQHIEPELFTPILMMRAERLSSPQEITDKIGECIVESKYDGFRVQLHYDRKKNEVRLYSRNLEDVSLMYPDIIEGVKKEAHVDSIIFEGEAIGFDPQTGGFLPFQETVQRKRKHGIAEKAKEIPLKLFAFEMLYKNGESYVQKPFLERRRTLEKSIKGTGDTFKDTILVAPEETTADPEKLDMLFEDAIAKGLEGIVAKKLDGVYQPGARGWNWIKFKRSYSSKIDDTIDCLVMGYDYGKGKRTDFGIGAFLVGIYDQKEDKFVTVAKIGTGLTDDEWREMSRQCEEFKSDSKPALYMVEKAMDVDIWVKPSIVVEIKADEITRSSVHTAGRVVRPTKSGQSMEIETQGYALRFPRLKRFRDDKRPEDVTTLREVESMFKKQIK